MYISHVSNNFSNPYLSKRQSVSNFKGSLSYIETKRVLNMLKPVVTSARITDSFDEIEKTINSLSQKYASWGVNSVGVMVIPNKDLISFTGSTFRPDEVAGKKAFCVAVGDKHGPIESWNTAYEAKLILLPENLFDKKQL